MNSICKIHGNKQFRKNNIFVPACDWWSIQTSQTSNILCPKKEIASSLESNDVELDRGEEGRVLKEEGRGLVEL